MAAFEWTPAGHRPLGAGPVDAPDVAGGSVAAAPKQAPPVAITAPQATVEPEPQSNGGKKLKPRNFKRELKQRLKEVQRELKTLKQLQDEELEIKRLLAALDAPVGKVRNIHSARNAG